MTVKIIIKRTVPPDKVTRLAPLIKQLRDLAGEQPGYISGETLKNLDESEKYLVISTWKDAADWKNWVESPIRKEVQEKIDLLTGVPTEYEVYSYSG
jgi:heme-degrading monooxygenase HmoA